MKNIFVVNSRGEREPFSFRKVYQSARRVGASKKFARQIAEKIRFTAKDGTRTDEIFNQVKKMLSQEIPGAALKFNLKKAMKKMGPTGFPFEKYVAEIFSRQGFKVRLNQHIQGACLNYEIDFLAEKGNLLYLAECKYRNLFNNLVHANDALISYARFLDIKKGGFASKRNLKALLATNTKFTTRTIKYSRCYNIELLGWRYPKGRGLEYFIDSQKLYPITILPSLDEKLADFFVSKKMMLAEDVLGVDLMRLAKEFKVPVKRLERLAKEADILINKE